MVHFGHDLRLLCVARKNACGSLEGLEALDAFDRSRVLVSYEEHLGFTALSSIQMSFLRGLDVQRQTPGSA